METGVDAPNETESNAEYKLTGPRYGNNANIIEVTPPPPSPPSSVSLDRALSPCMGLFVLLDPLLISRLSDFLRIFLHGGKS